jgi:uncharacterized protein YbcI
MAPPPQGRHGVAADGELEAAISTAMVQTLRRFTGRGPTRARTTVGDDVVICVMSATLTKGEQSLAEHEQDGVVLLARQAYQDIMSASLVDAVQKLTGRTVAAFMSCNHVDPDLAAEVFVRTPLIRTAP